MIKWGVPLIGAPEHAPIRSPGYRAQEHSQHRVGITPWSQKRGMWEIFLTEKKGARLGLRSVLWDPLPQQEVEYIHNRTHTQDQMSLIPYWIKYRAAHSPCFCIFALFVCYLLTQRFTICNSLRSERCQLRWPLPVNFWTWSFFIIVITSMIIHMKWMS